MLDPMRRVLLQPSFAPLNSAVGNRGDGGGLGGNGGSVGGGGARGLMLPTTVKARAAAPRAAAQFRVHLAAPLSVSGQLKSLRAPTQWLGRVLPETTNL